MDEISGKLTGKLLLAMPTMTDPRFYKSVIFMCTHDESGAMGLIINQSPLNMAMSQLLNQLNIQHAPSALLSLPVLTGGPVEPGQGFMLHTSDFEQPETIKVNEKFGVSGTIEALRATAEGKGPKELIFTLGYSGWSAGQLEEEIQENAWMIAEATHELLFNTPIESKWDRAMARIGVNPVMLSTVAGSA
jgi:putative transcriptional regulator